MLSSRNWCGAFRLLLNGAVGCGHVNVPKDGGRTAWWGLTRVSGQAGSIQIRRHYPRNPMERRKPPGISLVDSYITMTSSPSSYGAAEGSCWRWPRREGREGEEEGRQERHEGSTGHLGWPG